MSFRIYERSWDAIKLLAPVNAQVIRWSDDMYHYEPIIWRDLCSEFDAEDLYTKIKAARPLFSLEMQQVMAAWKRDERNHFTGFRRVYQLLYAEEENVITEKVINRKLDYSAIEPLLRDEFSLCLLLAYDELISAKGYAADCRFYDQLGPVQLQVWIRRVAGDEAMHYGNFLNVLRQNHQHRWGEAEAILGQILTLDLSRKEYTGGFVFDHKDESFGKDFLAQCIQKILSSMCK